MSSEVKHYWPEEIVGTGECVVYLQDYAALKAERDALAAECERLRSLLDELHPYVRGCPIDLWDRYHPALIGKKAPSK